VQVDWAAQVVQAAGQGRQLVLEEAGQSDSWLVIALRINMMSSRMTNFK
jgi:hypothetical protein